uniref:Allatostatin A n=1 Tax=Glossina brevipalpis TaxID=37001 RepID=A0A1A9WC19_9MUSC
MMNLHFTCLLVLLLVCWLNMFYCSNYDDNVPNDMHASQLNSLLSINAENNMERDDEKNNYDKRVERYAFGLGRRGYTYTNGNGMKRLPVYNFGLGKRDPYSFDLSKRSDLNGIDNELLVNQELNKNFNTAALLADEKRNQPYSFGLGKREPSEEAGRRAYPMRYGFGLGR